MAFGTVTLSEIITVTDNDLEFTVNSMFSALAGFESGAAS